MEPRLQTESLLPQAGLEPGTARSVGQHNFYQCFFLFQTKEPYTVDSRYLDFGYLE